MIQIGSELLAGDFLKLALSQRRYCQWGNAHGRATPPDTRSHQSRPEPAPAPLVACSSGGARKRVLTPSARARATTNGGLSSGKNAWGEFSPRRVERQWRGMRQTSGRQNHRQKPGPTLRCPPEVALFLGAAERKKESPANRRNACPSGSTADTRSMPSLLAEREIEVPQCYGRKRLLHGSSGPLHQHHPEVGTGYCRLRV